ncbi:hypothetical protein N7478_004729 [Penicillium angulare]|uniref:uncharacterized protein n=1 Tax=Penicillium angulare TaxID=116970 RepID=UPI0025413D21|nr:uncharacterized protein N7478_004729 [Penicillium angulare]KAJ5279357.1 hypothetical protein N7478_004729 [Penicillium angulare]
MDAAIPSKRSKSTVHASSRPNKTLNLKTASHRPPQHVNKPSSCEHSDTEDPGFAQFLQDHSSPRHQRVTAGGKIVPMKPNEKRSHPGELPATEGLAPPLEMPNMVQSLSQMRQVSMQRQAEEVLNEMSAQLHAFQPSHNSTQTPLHPQGEPYSLAPAINTYETFPCSRPILNCIPEEAPFGTVPNGPLYMGCGPIPDFGQTISHQASQSLPMQMPLQLISTFWPETTSTVFNELYSYISQSAPPVGAIMPDMYDGEAEALMISSSITAALQQSISGAPIGLWNWMGLITNVVEHSMGDMERLFQAYYILTVHRANIQQMIINTSVNIAWTQVTHPFQRDYRVMYINMRDMVDRALQIIEFLIEDSRNEAANQNIAASGSTQDSCYENKFHLQSHEKRQEENKEPCMNGGTNAIASSSSSLTSNEVAHRLRRPRMIDPYTPRLLSRTSQPNQLDGACSDMGTRHVEDDELWPNVYPQNGCKTQHNTIASVPEYLHKLRDDESDNTKASKNHVDEGTSALDTLFRRDCDEQQKKNDSHHSVDRDLDNATLLSNISGNSLHVSDIKFTNKERGNFEDILTSSRESSVEVEAQSILHTDVQSIFWELNLSKHSVASLQDPEPYGSEIEIGEGSLGESAIDIDQIDILAQAGQLEYETDTTARSVTSDDWSICVNSTKYPTHSHKSKPTSDATTVSRSSICPNQLKSHERLSVATTFDLNNR